MKKVKSRAISVLILVVIALLGMGFYVGRYIINGSDWAAAPVNAAAFRRGILMSGEVRDRNGVVLASIKDGNRIFADNADVRRATLHAVGDTGGNIGTGALVAFASDLTGYNLITGSFSLTNTGRTVDLTIDSKLNEIALRELAGRRGVVMVSNYKTGEIICMVSSPTFDPINPPVNPSDDEAPYLNRAIQADYPPGSTFKLITAAAALDRIRNVYDLTFNCEGNGQGELIIGNDLLICLHGPHGTLGIEQGMIVSCNIVFGELALELGADFLAEYAEKAGLSVSTRVSGIRTASGNFDKGDPGSIFLAWSGIGQFNNQVCPASMLRFVGAVANDGNAVELHYNKRSGLSSFFSAGTRRILNRNTASELGDLIKISNSQNLEMYAKTGTAQVGSDLRPHAWYTGYITNPDHPYAFVVIVENSGSGREIAAPIANRVLLAAIS